MIDALAEVNTYFREQKQAIDDTDKEQLSALVINGIHTLAARYFDPVVHECSKTVPETKDEMLRSELEYRFDKVLVDPRFEGLLPARFSQARHASEPRSDGLLLPMDSGVLKIQTSADHPTSASTVYMKITNYGRATSTEAAAYRRIHPLLIIAHDAILFVPHKTVEYSRRLELGHEACICSSKNIRKPAEDVYYNSEYPGQLQPQAFLTMNEVFIFETRMALTSLQTLLA